MKKIVDNAEDQSFIDNEIWGELENKYGIKIRKDIKEFLGTNSGGYPSKSMINTKDGEHEVRKVLSLNENNKYYFIKKIAERFLTDTKGRIIPIAVDSAGNYFCANNETDKVYFWSAEENLYYLVEDSIDEFSKCF